MKKIVCIVALFATSFAFRSYGQEAKPSLLPQLLSDYYNIKNALVSGNAATASLKAADFIKTINGVDYKVISEGNVNTLLKDAGKIAESKDLKKQREYFSNFSGNMIAVAKAVKLGDKETYVQYCPMKNASWLSNEKAIKNPYYGSAMLTCGEVTGTIK
jgi:hypothetical protein